MLLAAHGVFTRAVMKKGGDEWRIYQHSKLEPRAENFRGGKFRALYGVHEIS